MKAFFIKFLKAVIKPSVPYVIDAAIPALQRLAHQSDNTIDDELVGTLIANKEKLITAIKQSL